MNNPNKIILIFVLIAALAVAVFWWLRQPETQSAGAVTSAPQQQGTAASSGAGTAPVRTPTRAQQILAAATANDEETAFYGRVIDQDGNPVGGAKVVGGAQYNTFVTQGVRNYKTFTDEAGNFTFPKIQGKDFACEPWKEGYIYQAAKNYNGYILSKLASMDERFVADPKKPEIFRLWKIKGSEPLLAGGLAFYIPSDGTPVYVDLKTGKESTERGDIAFWCRYKALPEETPFDERAIEWTFGVKIVGGGVIPTDSRLPYGAPQDGYQEQWEFKIGKGTRGPILHDQTLYFKTANQEYGALNLEALYNPIRPQCSTGIGWKINPSGSRNLEPGKEQMIRKGSFGKPGLTLQYLRLKQG